METLEYRQFMQELAEFAKLPDAENFYRDANLIVDDVDFALLEANRGSDIGIAVYCDLGSAPHTNRVAVLERLLEMNMAIFSADPVVFSMNPDTGRVVLNIRLSIMGVTPGQIISYLYKHAECAKQWGKTYFLVEDEESRPPARPGAGAGARDPRFRLPV
jgi:hypothetical protein